MMFLSGLETQQAVTDLAGRERGWEMSVFRPWAIQRKHSQEEFLEFTKGPGKLPEGHSVLCFRKPGGLSCGISPLGPLSTYIKSWFWGIPYPAAAGQRLLEKVKAEVLAKGWKTVEEWQANRTILPPVALPTAPGVPPLPPFQGQDVWFNYTVYERAWADGYFATEQARTETTKITMLVVAGVAAAALVGFLLLRKK